ncbi:MAG: hypothetical protein EZS28_001657 [Streblomastix strix]|uniref:DDE-1 domain-containing protein n=1 Tax=Streblomastix strix TaxID=222440 RepID=A0A5J4X6C0_9EUKA|nr:MAG: hypothetical protein EZS28_001657 [Streblomastix strix]
MPLNEKSVQLMDNLLARITRILLSYLTINNILVTMPPPNAIYLFQASDLDIFGLHKSHIQTLRRNYWIELQEIYIGRTISALKQAQTSTNIWNGFLSRDLREIVNAVGRMVAEYVPESIVVVIKTTKQEGVLIKESQTRETQKRAITPCGFVNYDFIVAYA